MKKILRLIFVLLILSSCSKKSYLDRSNEDRALLDAVKKLSKNATDDDAQEAVPILYKSIKQTHLAKIKSYNSSKDPGRWYNIIGEFQDLQNAYDAIINCTPAFKLVTPENYNDTLSILKKIAAEEYYMLGDSALAKEGRNNSRAAYDCFKRANYFFPNFKDAAAKMQTAIDRAMINVVVYPVQDNSFLSGSGWNNVAAAYANENMQSNLIRDMGGKNEKRYPAKFYSDRDVYRENINPDWMVDMILKSLDIPYPSSSNYNRNASKQITIGADTTGRPIYQTIYATVRITRSSFTARAQMEVTVKDVVNKKNISSNTYQEDFHWEQETATYTGDNRALSSADWELINNTGNNIPAKDYILNELYKKLYPRIRSHVMSAVEW